MAKINDLTGETTEDLMDKVNVAYSARFGTRAPTMTLAAPKEDPNVLGRVHFSVKKGSSTIGKGMFKPRHRSVWVDWK